MDEYRSARLEGMGSRDDDGMRRERLRKRAQGQNMTEADSHLQARLELCKNLQKLPKTLCRVLARQTRGEQGLLKRRYQGQGRSFLECP